MIDFDNYPLSGKSLIAIGPGRVHAWHVKNLTGLYIAFTQEFFDGKGPPPSALFDCPFIFGGEVSPVVRLKPKQGEQAQNLFREVNQEFHFPNKFPELNSLEPRPTFRLQVMQD